MIAAGYFLPPPFFFSITGKVHAEFRNNEKRGENIRFDLQDLGLRGLARLGTSERKTV